MRKLWLIGLAASAAWAPAAAAQSVPDADPLYGLAAARLNVPVAASAAAAAMDHPGHETAVGHGPGPQMEVRHDWRDGDMRRDHRRPHWRRINRGHFVPGFWMGPQFVVQDWGPHGFPRPARDRRWIRYYDDALLVDGYGRVHDGRYGYDWSRYRDRWSYRDGVPVYVGRGDYYPDERDYEWAERWDRRGDDYRYGRGGPMPGCHDPCAGAYPAPAPAYGYGCGYPCGGMVVTETITTTAPVVETETYYEYVTEEVAAPRRAYRKPVRRAPARRAPPPPRPGERG